VRQRRKEHKMATRKALIPLDGSPFSRQVLSHVHGLLNPDDYTLVLLQVAPPPRSYTPPPRRMAGSAWATEHYDSSWDAEQAAHPIYDTQIWDNIRTMLLDDMAPEARRLKEAGFGVSVEVRFGEPAQEIVDLVEEEGIDLVVMSTHGRGGLARLLMGSVAQSVPRRLSVPVMMVRPVKTAAEVPAEVAGD
jgi:nucleotide-binding universal stress UspA family protein